MSAGARGAAFLGVLKRLRRDRAGNVLAIGAVALVPMIAASGSAIDLARLYVTRVRLQQACDAGVLAGRRLADPANTTATLDDKAAAQARTFFGNNFHTGMYATTDLGFTPTKTSGNTVSGRANATVPLAVMGYFGVQPVVLNVTCEARYDIADADVMFVLDTTGSMACLTSDSDANCTSYAGGNVVTNSDGSYSVTEKTDSRIAGLRGAVLDFFDDVTGAADASTNFRFGFVPYSASVNPGEALRQIGAMRTGSVAYQSRQTKDANKGSPSTTTTTNVKQSDCTSSRSPASGYDSNGQAVVTTATYTSASNGTCKLSKQTVTFNWVYNQYSFPIVDYVAGKVVPNPAQLSGSSAVWNGCVEERMSNSGETGASFDPLAPPLSLDVDTGGTTDDTKWAPMWRDVEFARKSTPEQTSDNTRTIAWRSGNNDTTTAIGLNELPCPLKASRLSANRLPAGSSAATKAALRNQIQAYLSASNGFRPYGVTYHDYGMTWGTRLIAPNGPFAADTVAWPGHNVPNRFIIFLTDGALYTDPNAYTSNGIEAFDNRTGAGTDNTALTANHNARFSAACTIAKNRNIKIYVISYATALTTQLKACASPGGAFTAANKTGLKTAFTSIAKQVAMLRLSQ